MRFDSMLVVLVLCLSSCTSAEPAFRPAELTAAAPVPHGDSPAAAAHPEHGTPTEPPVRLIASPMDLTTAFRGVPEVAVAGPASDRELDAIADAIHLVSWPDGVDVAFEVQYLPPEMGASAVEHRFLVHPARALDPGWYALEVGAVDASRFNVTLPRDGDVARARFRVGSGPVVSGVSFGPGDTETGVSISLSERIVDDRPIRDLVVVEVGGRELACDTRGAEYLGELGMDAIELVCDHFDLADDVTIRLNGDLLTTVGTVLEVPFGASRTELVVNPTRGGLVVDEAALLADPPTIDHARERR